MKLDLTEDQQFFQETVRRSVEMELPISKVRELIDAGPYLATDAVDVKLIDKAPRNSARGKPLDPALKGSWRRGRAVWSLLLKPFRDT